VLPPPSVAASEPSSSVVATKAASGLVECDYADVRASAEQVLRFLDRMKNVVVGKENLKVLFSKGVKTLLFFLNQAIDDNFIFITIFTNL
jgi:hypothetical protein